MVIFRQEVLSQHKSEGGGGEELSKEQRDAVTFCHAQGSSAEHHDVSKQGAGLRGGAQCTQVLETTTQALLECHCRSAVLRAEHRDRQRGAHSIPSSLRGQQETPLLWHSGGVVCFYTL